MANSENKPIILLHDQLPVKKSELYPTILYFHIQNTSVQWFYNTLLEYKDYASNMPSGDTVNLTCEGQCLRFTKHAGTPFTYEDVRFILHRLHAHQLINAPALIEAMHRCRDVFPAEHTVFHIEESVFEEVSIKSGIHLFFAPSDDGYDYTPLFEVIEERVESVSNALQILIKENSMHITGDMINHETINAVFEVLHEGKYITARARKKLTKKILKQHVKDIATRELAILTVSLDKQETLLLRAYLHIFSCLVKHGKFSRLNPEQLRLLQSFHEDKKKIFTFPLASRISLRSIYICFHTEIEEALQEATSS